MSLILVLYSLAEWSAGPEREGALSNRVGVAIVLCCALSVRGRKEIYLYFVRELTSKPDYKKYCGMLSVVLETMGSEEGISVAVRRALEEEVGHADVLEVFPKHIMPTMISMDGFGSAHLVVIMLDERVAEKFQACPGESSEVEPVGWLSLGAVTKMLSGDADRPVEKKELRCEMAVIIPALKSFLVGEGIMV